MKKASWIIFFVLLMYSSDSQVVFEQYFESASMRFDYIITGNSREQHIQFEQLKKEPFWGGPRQVLIEPFDLGDYQFQVFDYETNELLYSRGFSDLFFEWQDTEEARYIDRSYYGSIVFPFPKNKIHLHILRRKRSKEWTLLHQTSIDPKHYFIQEETPPPYPVKTIQESGNPAEKIDLVILPEGYTKREMRKFKRDVKRFTHYFFQHEPFSSYRDAFNIHAVMAPSAESGTDIPGDSIWKNTLLNTHFYTFDSERYLTTRDVKTMRDVAAAAPYDQIYILVNTDKYGGGGIYNFYNLCSSDHPNSEKVFVHEFGHAFACLSDEYAYDATPADSLYSMNEELWQVNISNLVDFDSKWKDLVKESTPIPTPDTPEYQNEVGAFEGGGYTLKGIYRPTYDCRMRSNAVNDFCPVCERHLIEMIQFYTGESADTKKSTE